MPPFVLPDETGRMVNPGNHSNRVRRSSLSIAGIGAHGAAFPSTRFLARSRASPLPAPAWAVIWPDREQFAAEMKIDSKAAFPILTDMDNGYAMALNLAIWVGNEINATCPNAAISYRNSRATTPDATYPGYVRRRQGQSRQRAIC